MKIIVISNDAAGLALFRKDLLFELIKAENEVVALSPRGNRVNELEDIGVRFIETPMSRRGINPLKDMKLFFLYRKIIKREKPDFVITYTIKPNIYGGLCSRLMKIPYAANITGLGTGFQSAKLRRIIISLYKKSLKNSKVVFCENSAIKEELIHDRIVSSDRICVLSGAGVDAEKFYYQPYPKNEVFRFLFIGRVMREKGIDELIESINLLNENGLECRLTVVGRYKEDYSNVIENNKNIDYVGPQMDVRPFIAEADCFVLPSYHEGMANTNLECAASGRPIITSNIPGCLEAVIEGVSGFLCEPKNIESVYTSMKKMILLSRETRETMGKKGRDHMVECFDKKMVVKKTIDCLEIRT